MYPIIKKYGFKATAFIVGKETRETTPPYTTSETEDMRIGLDVMEKKTMTMLLVTGGSTMVVLLIAMISMMGSMGL